MDYIDPQCCFDNSAYIPTPDAAATAEHIDVPAIIRGLDALYERGREAEAESYLESWREKAGEIGDWRGELSMLSELLGQYRRSANRDRALVAIDEALELIKLHGLAETVSGATIMLNAATTMKTFGQAERSIPVFTKVARVFADNLDPTDYRMAGLYNNMALSYSDMGDIPASERCFKLALGVLSQCPDSENEQAVTWCNMAELYSKRDMEDGEIEKCMDKAWELLNAPGLKHDGYHAFTISKCAPTFDYFGYFLYSKNLKERAEKIYAGN